MSKLVLTFACGEFEDLIELSEKTCAQSYCAGISTGASYFGDGASAYRWPEDAEDMFEEQKSGAAADALAALERKGIKATQPKSVAKDDDA